MRVVVPFDPETPNERLSSLFSLAERREFAAAMLGDVLAAVRGAGGRPEVLAAAPLADTPAAAAVGDAPVVVDDRPLSEAVNAALADGLPAAVVMADLALATPDALAALFEREGDVVLARGRGGGTNAVVVRHPGFRVDYHGVSFRDHVAAAERVGATVATVDSFRLGVDVDDEADVLDVLVHGADAADQRAAAGRANGATAGSAAAGWLADAGVRVDVVGGEPTVVRDE
ncbi:2-phospho-L-lactate guanylyltransferase [Halobacterium yunchengense]|uniref:2-phospho-L-lactate guanylyltransferase n=1 Tax=Halobacterium yunchengense TaxID=3108497 RepID=UPI00300ADBA2